MKLITAIIRPDKLDCVHSALESIGVEGITVTEVKGYGKQKGHKEVYRGSTFGVDFRSKIKLEIGVTSALAEQVIDVVITAARSGNKGEIGDGKIFVTDLDKVVRIRTGETNSAAF